MHWRRLAPFIVALLATVALAWTTVPATIIPPAAPVDPVTVHVAEFELHTRLLLPQGDRWVQYGFGDWNYYALNRHDLPHALMALLVTTRGALGVGEFASLAEFQADLDPAGFELLSFEVSSAEVNQLMRSLHHRFERQVLNGQANNPSNNLRLVQDEQTYSLLHNSNHELAEWLEALNCQVKHLLLWTKFRLTTDYNLRE